MKKPQMPPDFGRVWSDYQEKYYDLAQRMNQKNEDSEEIRKLIRKYNEQEYIHWDDLRRKKIPFDPIAFWFVIRTIRGTKYREIRIGDEKFPFYTPENFQKQLHLLDKASPASFDWLFGEFPSEANKNQYLSNSLMEEAIASSQLEGAATTRPDAKKILREGRKPKNTSERMIVNNYRTICRLKKLRDKPLSRELILEIHREITHGTLDSESDETDFRTTDDIVVGSKADPTKIYHYPPEVAKLPAMIDDLIVFANEDDEFIHPIVKAIILHFLIGYIHPFNDGNGRTARAIFYWFSLKHHYDLLEYISISRIFVHAPAQYARAYQLTETDSNDMTYFIDFNIQIISRALEDLKKYIINKKEEEAESLQLVEQIPDLSFRQAEILRDFIRHPTRHYAISEIAGKYKVSLPTARTDLLLLEEKGKLKKYQDGKRQVFMLKQEMRG
ncbi:Fic family protein [Methanoregula sp.]|uniref:Fic family protein n=1 Tax=Methanoregula sp. TaxID=2052170 RepID=UPI00237130EE|nr:Fic family protein [Methanoregula sp.]MDD1686108.1 Fic family protein [Methanoregula sp.]